MYFEASNGQRMSLFMRHVPKVDGQVIVQQLAYDVVENSVFGRKVNAVFSGENKLKIIEV